MAMNSGRTDLMVASKEGHLEVVRLLLESGADKDLARNEDWTALFVASESGHLEVVRLLLQCGVDNTDSSHDGI